LRNLKQYWQSLFARTEKPANTHADTSSGTKALEHTIAAISSGNQTLAANLEELHRKIAAARNTDIKRLLELERANHALQTARQAEIERVAELESRLDEVTAERLQANDQIMELKTSLAATSTRLGKTDDQVKQLELEQRVHEQLQLETQTRLLTQDQRLSWTIMVAGFALVLATVSGAILILKLHRNEALLGSMSTDMQQLVTSMVQHIKTADQAASETSPPVITLKPAPTATEAATRYSTAEKTATRTFTEAVPEVVLETVPEAVPEAPLETVPEAVPETEAVPEAVPEEVSEAVDEAAGTTATPAYLSEPAIPDDDLQQHSQMLSAMQKNSILTEADVDWTMGNLPSGRLFRVETPGKGRSPEITDRVVVNYLAVSPDGKVINDTYSSGQPATLRMSEIGPVLQEALLNMGEGAEWEVTVPEQQPHLETQGPEPGLYLIELVEVIEGDAPGPSTAAE
jgi:FKBP-type peptidyl-prolyl cis-trans isomerase